MLQTLASLPSLCSSVWYMCGKWEREESGIIWHHQVVPLNYIFYLLEQESPLAYCHEMRLTLLHTHMPSTTRTVPRIYYRATLL